MTLISATQTLETALQLTRAAYTASTIRSVTAQPVFLDHILNLVILGEGLDVVWVSAVQVGNHASAFV